MPQGPAPAPGEVDDDLLNAGKQPATLLPGGCYFHHADSFAMMRGGHLDSCVLGAFQVSAAGDLAVIELFAGRAVVIAHCPGLDFEALQARTGFAPEAGTARPTHPGSRSGSGFGSGRAGSGRAGSGVAGSGPAASMPTLP